MCLTDITGYIYLKVRRAMRAVKVVCVLLILSFGDSSSSNIYSILCERILFKQPTGNKTLASKEIINGVYIKTSKIIDKFPVYKHERGKVYFQYSRSRNKFFFSSGNIGSDSYIGLGAYGVYNKMSDPNKWVHDSAGREDNIFGNIISTWFQWYHYPSKAENSNLDSQLVAKCVHFTDCGFNDLAFTQINGGKLSVDVFKTIDNVYKNYRRIYIHSTGKLYLFFNNNYWNIGADYNSNFVIWFVDDQALKPEFITSIWKKWSGIKWEYKYSARVECNGVDKNCTEWHCQNNGRCSSNSFNNSLCSCPFYYTGTKCENSIRNFCPSNSYTKFLKSYGAIESVFCQGDYFYTMVCKRNVKTNALEWVSDNQCNVYTSTSRKPMTAIYSTSKKQIAALYSRDAKKQEFNADDHIWILGTALVGSMVVPVFVASFISVCCRLSYARVTSLVFYICKYIVQIFHFKASQKLKNVILGSTPFLAEV